MPRQPLVWMLAAAVLLVTGVSVWLRAEPPAPVASQASLLEILRSEASVEQKADACRQLERVGTKDAVPALAALLSHEQLSHKARMALEQINDPAVDEALRGAMAKLHGRLLIGVVQSIGHRRDGTAVDALVRLLDDRNNEVASSAAYALGSIGTAEATKALEASLAGPPEDLKPALWDALLRAGEALAAQGKREAAVSLYDRLRSSDAPAHVRAGAARGAVVARQAGGVGILAELLHDRDWTIFNMALRLAVELPGDAVTQAVAAQVQKLQVERQALVIQALGNRGDKAALPEVRSMMKKGNAAVRIAAIRAAAQMEDKASLPAILEAAGADDKSVGEAAIAALIRLPGGEVDAALLEWVNAKDTARSLMGIDCLARRQSASAGSALLKAATAGEDSVRLAAIKAMGDVGTAAELRPLVNLLLKAPAGAEKDAIEQAVVALCASIAEKDASEQVVIEALAAAAGPEQKVILLQLLGNLGGAKSLAAMRAVAGDANAEVQEAAIRGLCNWPTVAVAADLMQLARNAAKPNHRILALRGWLRLAGDARLAVEKRLEMCEQAAPLLLRVEEKRQFLAALSDIATSKSLAMIATQLEDQTVKEEACAAAVGVASKLSHPSSTGVDTAAVARAMERVKAGSRNARTIESADAVLARLKQKAGK